ncbi:MAG: hypothetical protein PF569_02385 [Candidatus Woesearchaeota archaeon]|jgi:hypothetical protein|nr:hypothetical protein [Candidatus Woesearchaeota archaeon]
MLKIIFDEEEKVWNYELLKENGEFLMEGFGFASEDDIMDFLESLKEGLRISI